MRRTVNALRILWIVLIAILAVLILANAISGIATALYGVVVLAVMFAEIALRGKFRQS
jgi:O-antigen ligase